jgi:hypothetical protein
MWNWMRSASRSARLLTCGPPGDDLDVEAAFGVGAIGDRLVEAAMFGLGQPVGPKGHLFQLLGRRPGRGRRDENEGGVFEQHASLPVGLCPR